LDTESLPAHEPVVSSAAQPEGDESEPSGEGRQALPAPDTREGEAGAAVIGPSDPLWSGAAEGKATWIRLEGLRVVEVRHLGTTAEVVALLGGEAPPGD
jgi:hypothetical protein